MPKPISLTSEADFSEAVEAAKQIRDKFSLGENVCFPRPSFVHSRDSASDLRILFYGQAYANNPWREDWNYSNDFGNAVDHAHWQFTNKIRSSFWYGTRAVIADFLGADRYDTNLWPQLYQHIGWSNILKISPLQENPGGAFKQELIAAQSEMCTRHIRNELAQHGKFDAVVFLSNDYCWSEFLESGVFPNFERDKKSSPGDGIVQWVKTSEFGPVIFSRHPRDWRFWSNFNEILEALKECIDPDKLHHARSQFLEQAA